MTLKDLAEKLPAEIIHRTASFERDPVAHVVASDLMSDVLVVDVNGLLLITSLASEQTVRTGHVVGALGIILANGKPLPAGLADLCRELDINMLQTWLPKFEACVRVGRLLNIRV